MSLAIAIVNNSTIVRSDFGVRWLLRAYFAVVSLLFPRVARRQAEQLFTQPPRYAGRHAATTNARRDIVVSGAHTLAVWQAGPAAAPGVLLAHGWGGRAAQMRSFVAPLLARGYRVVWFDQPGHGESSGRNVALPDFARAVETVALSHGPFAAAIGHSLGGAALGLALRAGLALNRVVFVSTPSSLIEHTHNFARMLGIPPAIRDAMRGHLECRYGIRFSEIDRVDALARLRLPALFVHDRDDRDVPYAHALRLSARMRSARLVTTHGFGHRRLLREPSVVNAVVDFVAGSVDDLPADLPVLPRPAPLY